MKTILVFFLIFSSIFSFSQGDAWLTYFEQSGGLETPRLKQVIDFCQKLDDASSMITFQSFGQSARGLELPLMVVDKEGFSDPESIRQAGRIILLVQACIHPGESEGKDAGLMLLRDMAIYHKHQQLLNHVSILFIPIFNVDGHERFGPYNRINQNGPKEMGWRVTANNLNLNRDYLKADTPEMNAWLRLFNQWLPDFFIDTHTTDGADYQYAVTYGMETLGDMDPALTKWSKETFLNKFSENMERSGFPVFPYVEFRKWTDPKSGLLLEVGPPMLSQVYTSLRNRPGLLIETHMLKPYDQRVKSTYECIKATLMILDKEYGSLEKLENAADRFVSSPEFRKGLFPLEFKVLETDSTLIPFKGIAYQRIRSDITGEYYCKYGKEKELFTLACFSNNIPDKQVFLPDAYIIPPEWGDVIRRLGLHGIRIKRTLNDTMIRVSVYRFNDPKWQVNPYEGRHPMTKIDAAESNEEMTFPAGSAIIQMDQPSARIIAHLLEPNGNGSFLWWGFFDAVFEQKEYAESYVIEPLAAKMLENDPNIKAEFEKKKAGDSLFAKNPNLINRWFFSKTPYWDSRKNLYPVGRIFLKK